MSLWSMNWVLLIEVCFALGQLMVVLYLLIITLTRLNEWLRVLQKPQSRLVDPRWRDDR